MIITKLAGGLGNQMFQYAAGRRAALVNNAPLKLDVSGYKHQNSSDTKRSYEIDIFNIQAEIARETEIEKLKGTSGTYLERVIRSRLPWINGLVPTNKKYYIENPYQKFEKRILEIKTDAYLEGWWQTYKYFEDCSGQIRKDFTFKDRLLPKNRKFEKEILSGECLGVHVRLGDYVKKYSDYFAQCSPAYYQKGISLIMKKKKVSKIIVLVEDETWVKKHLKLKIPVVNIVSDMSPRDWQDYMQLLSMCKHNIIANSSFSWWAAYLNSNPEKIIVSPKKWFNDPKIDISARLPDSWIKI